MLLLWTLYMVPALFVILVDPHDHYPWGARIRPIVRHDPDNAARMIDIAVGDRDADTLLVGSSVIYLIEPADVRAALPGTKIVWNLSYAGGGAADRQMVLDRIAQRSRARRILVTLDYYLAVPARGASPVFPAEMFDRDPTNDLRVVDFRTLRETRNALLYGTPFPDHSEPRRALRRLAERGLDDPKALARVMRVLRNNRATIDVGEYPACSSFPTLPRFEGAIRRLAAQGRRVDVVLPAYSPGFYYRPRQNRMLYAAVGDTFLKDQLAMRRCVVTALAGTPNVFLSALDQDLTLINDLSNFEDLAHLTGRENFRRLLAATLDPRYRLTSANIDAYVEQIRRNVKGFCGGNRLPRGC